MCCNFSIINQTKNGMLIYLRGCQKYQLTFNNLSFSLTTEELNAFYRYLRRVNTNYWEEEYANSVYEKKIPIPTLQDNFIIMINRIELFELQLLTGMKQNDSHLILKNLVSNCIWN